MKETQFIMGMPITIEINGPAKAADLEEEFEYFREIDGRYSTYKRDSEVSLLNSGVPVEELSSELQFVLDLCDKTRLETEGYFNIQLSDGTIDPSGLVKGWAIQNSANRLLLKGWTDFYIEAGGDVQVHGMNSNGAPWELGIRNPFEVNEVVKVLHVSDCGIASSGNYIRGDHIYDPLNSFKSPDKIVSLTIIGPNIYDADRFATAAFSMGLVGIEFVENLKGFEGYMINDKAVATFTSGFEAYVS